LKKLGEELRSAARHRGTQRVETREGFELEESLHAAAVTSGEERSWISAAVSLSTIIIGPPHLGKTKDRWTGGGDRLLGLRCRAEQLEAKWQGGSTFAVGQEAEVADAHETFREQVQQKAAQELIER